MTDRPFRFGIHMMERVTSRAEWVEKVRKAEGLGYAILTVPDHFTTHLAWGPLLATAAAATTTLRFGTFVLDNDFRHPAVVAAEAGMLDVLSDGRFELGIGAGWARDDYASAGIAFEPGQMRFMRLTESVRIIRGLFADEPVTFAGEHYTITDMRGLVTPVQRPHPPLLIGGGGRRLLTFAAQEADIVSIVPRALPSGRLDDHDITAALVEEKLGWVRHAAWERGAAPELNVLIQRVVVTDDRAHAATDLAARWGSTPPDILDSPFILAGSVEQIASVLQHRRERHGISYITVFERDFDAFAPVVALLAGR
jgi:probable F420-dependent oxidoreductase